MLFWSKKEQYEYFNKKVPKTLHHKYWVKEFNEKLKPKLLVLLLSTKQKLGSINYTKLAAQSSFVVEDLFMFMVNLVYEIVNDKKVYINFVKERKELRKCPSNKWLKF